MAILSKGRGIRLFERPIFATYLLDCLNPEGHPWGAQTVVANSWESQIHDRSKIVR